ncbi:exopolysaccharide biosynthesis protein [Salinarimonas rosea]|uniref:exopolysaccharide biosynthesis protein n=1 Tax=Salinarimonas rosea TaxID=552063 RepID=UPI00041F1F9F|nr:exopolysaccharide biosynthesis protein [Salinarimonas rosea]
MQRTSEILERLVENETAETLTLGEIVLRLRARSFGVLLILFAAPMLIPTPPGFSTVAAALIVLVAFQFLVMRRSLWMPRRLARRTVRTDFLQRVVAWTVPKLKRIERWSRPRAVSITRLRARRPLGVLILILAAIMALPIPVVGNTPPAIAIVLMGFGMIERDGAFVGAGVTVGILAIGLIAGLGLGLTAAFEAFVPASWLAALPF